MEPVIIKSTPRNRHPQVIRQKKVLTPGVIAASISGLGLLLASTGYLAGRHVAKPEPRHPQGGACIQSILWKGTGGAVLGTLVQDRLPSTCRRDCILEAAGRVVLRTRDIGLLSFPWHLSDVPGMVCLWPPTAAQQGGYHQLRFRSSRFVPQHLCPTDPLSCVPGLWRE